VKKQDDPSELPFYFGHFNFSAICCDIVFVNSKTKRMISCKNLQIDPGFSGGILISKKMAIYLDTVSLYDQKFELGDKNPLEGCAHQSSLLNDLWIMGRDSPSLKSKVKLISRRILTGIFVPDGESDLVLFGLQFLESLFVNIITSQKTCQFGYSKKEIKKNVFEFETEYENVINQEKPSLKIQDYDGEIDPQLVFNMLI